LELLSGRKGTMDESATQGATSHAALVKPSSVHTVMEAISIYIVLFDLSRMFALYKYITTQCSQ